MKLTIKVIAAVASLFALTGCSQGQSSNKYTPLVLHTTFCGMRNGSPYWAGYIRGAPRADDRDYHILDSLSIEIDWYDTSMVVSRSGAQLNTEVNDNGYYATYYAEGLAYADYTQVTNCNITTSTGIVQVAS